MKCGRPPAIADRLDRKRPRDRGRKGGAERRRPCGLTSRTKVTDAGFVRHRYDEEPNRGEQNATYYNMRNLKWLLHDVSDDQIRGVTRSHESRTQHQQSNHS